MTSQRQDFGNNPIQKNQFTAAQPMRDRLKTAKDHGVVTPETHAHAVNMIKNGASQSGVPIAGKKPMPKVDANN